MATQQVCGILDSPCQSVHLDFIVIISTPNGWISFKFGIWLSINGTILVAVWYLLPERDGVLQHMLIHDL